MANNAPTQDDPADGYPPLWIDPGFDPDGEDD